MSIKITSITKYRALMLVAATELGWKHSQASTNGDVFTKGTEAIHVVWGATQMVGFTHTKGKGLVKEAKGEVKSKLQRLQTQLGKPMDLDKKWPKLKASQVEALEALAVASFREIPTS